MAAGSGVLYGSINVAAKRIDVAAPWATFLLYAASALVLAPALRGLRIERRDWPKVAAMGAFGAGIAPLLLLLGLRQALATDAGLLLSMEMVATAALAYLFLGERFRRREVAGLACLLATAALAALATA